MFPEGFEMGRREEGRIPHFKNRGPYHSKLTRRRPVLDTLSFLTFKAQRHQSQKIGLLQILISEFPAEISLL